MKLFHQSDFKEEIYTLELREKVARKANELLNEELKKSPVVYSYMESGLANTWSRTKLPLDNVQALVFDLKSLKEE